MKLPVPGRRVHICWVDLNRREAIAAVKFVVCVPGIELYLGLAGLLLIGRGGVVDHHVGVIGQCEGWVDGAVLVAVEHEGRLAVEERNAMAIKKAANLGLAS